MLAALLMPKFPSACPAEEVAEYEYTFDYFKIVNMKKVRDCVEMKHQAARIIQRKVSHLTREEELEYWKVKGQELREQQRKL